MSDRLAEIKAREQAAFGGPWEVLDADENGMHAVAVDGTVLVEVGDFCDAEFIAHARDDIPHLLALVESLTADRVEALADAADDTDGEHSHRPYDGVDGDCGQCWVCEVRDALRITASLAGLAAEERDMWRGRAERARAVVARVESLAGQWERLAYTAINPDSREWLQACAATLRECLSGWQKMHDALAGSEADTSDTQPTDQEDQS